MKVKLTCWSLVSSWNALNTCSSFTPPPTSRKLAGSPLCSLIMSIVAMAKPAPLTVGGGGGRGEGRGGGERRGGGGRGEEGRRGGGRGEGRGERRRRGKGGGEEGGGEAEADEVGRVLFLLL